MRYTNEDTLHLFRINRTLRKLLGFRIGSIHLERLGDGTLISVRRVWRY